MLGRRNVIAVVARQRRGSDGFRRRVVLDQVEVRGRVERAGLADWACGAVVPEEQVFAAALVVPQAAAGSR